MSGTVESIHIAPAEGAPVAPVPQVHVRAGQGLEGDRYFGPAHAEAPPRAWWKLKRAVEDCVDAIAIDRDSDCGERR